MTYLIKATDTSGVIHLHRDTRAGAVKKASELLSDGCWDVEVRDPENQLLPIGQASNLDMPVS